MTAKDQLPAVRPNQNQAPAFAMDNNFSVSDILSVAVSEAEGKLNVALKVGAARAKAIEVRIKTIGKELDAEIDVMRKDCGLQDDIDNANKLLEKLFESSISYSAEINAKQKVVVYQYGWVHSHSHKKVPFSAEMTRLVTLLDSEKDSLESARAEVAEIRKRLANIPALERRYRGKLVANQLAKTAEGKSVLEVITANMEDELKNI